MATEYITNLTAFRCDEDGNESYSDSTYVRITFDYDFGVGSYSTMNLSWSPVGSTTQHLISLDDYNSSKINGSLDFIVGTHPNNSLAEPTTFVRSMGYVFTIQGDSSVGTYSASITLPRNDNFCYIDLKPSEDETTNIGGIGIGKEAELDNVLDIGYQTKFSGGILHPDLEDNVDIDTLITPNVYNLSSMAIDVNNTSWTISGVLKIDYINSRNIVRHTIEGYTNENAEYPRFVRIERYYNSTTSTWSDWRDCTLSGKNNVDAYPTNSCFVIPVTSGADNFSGVYDGFMVVQWGRVSVSWTASGTTVSNTVELTYPYEDVDNYQVFANVYNKIPSQVQTGCYNLTANGFKIYSYYGGSAETISGYIGWVAIGYSETDPRHLTTVST